MAAHTPSEAVLQCPVPGAPRQLTSVVTLDEDEFTGVVPAGVVAELPCVRNRVYRPGGPPLQCA